MWTAASAPAGGVVHWDGRAGGGSAFTFPLARTAPGREVPMAAATLTVRDESLAGTVDRSFELEFPTERITVRELIRERVYQEVQDYNREKAGAFRGLVQPTDAEVALNGYRLKPGREINWKTQYEKACEAFEAGRVLVLVGDRQATSLEETIEIGRGTEVSFLRLVPLVGG